MQSKYKDIGHPTIRFIEECGELIKAISKAERFGWDNFHPDNYPCHSLPKKEWCDHSGKGGFMGHTCGKPRTNLDEVQEEMNDVLKGWVNLLNYLKEENREKD